MFKFLNLHFKSIILFIKIIVDFHILGDDLFAVIHPNFMFFRGANTSLHLNLITQSQYANFNYAQIICQNQIFRYRQR